MEEFNYQAHLDFIKFIKENFRPPEGKSILFYFDNVENTEGIVARLYSGREQLAHYLRERSNLKKGTCLICYDNIDKDWIIDLETEYMEYSENLITEVCLQNDIKIPFKYRKALVINEMDQLIELLISGKEPPYRPSNC